MVIDQILHGHSDKIQLHHVRMAFSRGPEDIGQFQFGKILHLFVVIWQIWLMRLRYPISILYYPPAPPQRLPLVRDVVVLLSTRWLFKHVVFHFHACGISELYPGLPGWFKPFFRLAYCGADVAITASPSNIRDGQALQIRREILIPLGIEDHAGPARPTRRDGRHVILYVGMLYEDRGLLLMVDALENLVRRGLDVRLELVGGFLEPGFEPRLLERIRSGGAALEGRVALAGVLTGDDKWAAYRRADVFCFPTFVASETFGLVLIEAMQFGLPVVATRWHAIPDIVRDGETGFLIPVRDVTALTDRLEQLLRDPDLRERIGRRARAVYCTTYTQERFLSDIERVFLELAD